MAIDGCVGTPHEQSNAAETASRRRRNDSRIAVSGGGGALEAARMMSRHLVGTTSAVTCDRLTEGLGTR